MRRAVLIGLVLALSLPVTGGAKPTKSQEFFRKALLDDPRTSAGVKRLLRTNAGIVDPRSGFADVTGDDRSDALVLVTTGGAAGTVALYVLSTHGQKAGDDEAELKVIHRNQSLYRATVKLSPRTITLLEPVWAAGDDLCCPARRRERDYTFDDASKSFRRTDDRTYALTR